MNVLLIEEDRLSAFELAQSLEKQSIEALIVHDVVTAESIIANITFDVILLNVYAPQTQQFQLSDHLRSTANTPDDFDVRQGLECHCIKGRRSWRRRLHHCAVSARGAHCAS